ncbi:MAG: hypothetical protein ABI321_22820 [Polyangia bacterium]
MRSELTLGLVFLAFAAFPAVAVPGAHLTPCAWALVGLLAVAGALAITKIRPAYYVALVAATTVVLSGVLTWAGIGGGKLGLPMHPLLQAVLGLYLVFRVALAHGTFGRGKAPRPRLSDDPAFEEAATAPIDPID